jgi:hypothetical protein
MPVYNATLLLVPDKNITGSNKFKDKYLGELIEKIGKRARLYASKSEVTLDDQKRIQVELNDVYAKDGLEKAFTGSSILEIWEVYYPQHFHEAFNKANEIYRKDNINSSHLIQFAQDTITNYDTNLLSNVDTKTRKQNEKQTAGLFSLLNLHTSKTEVSELEAGFGHIKAKDTSTIIEYLTKPEVIKLLPSDLIFVFGKDPSTDFYSDSTQALFAIKTYDQPNKPFLTDKDIKSARQDFNELDGRPNIIFDFNPNAEKVWENLTEKNVGKCIALLIDKKVISAPKVTEKIFSGMVVINGSFLIIDASIIASQLNSGRLPVPLAVESLRIIKVNPANKKKVILLATCFAFCFGLTFLVFYQLKPPVTK